jgi:hypothetical protein
MSLSPLQKFETRDIHRREIKNAPYSPHFITPERREKLLASLKEFGLVNSLVWNPRTGNLVSGNKRLGIIDDLSATGDDYSLTVNVVDLDEDREKALSVILNHGALQGEFDDVMLAGLVAELEEKLTFDLAAIIGEAEQILPATLRPVTILPPPRMAWVLVGIPLVEFGAIAAQVEALAQVPNTIVESTFSDGERQDGQP